MLGIIRQYKGWVRFSIEGAEIGKFMSLSMQRVWRIWHVSKRGDQVYGSCYAREYGKMARLARSCHCRIKVLERHGMPFVINRYRWRWGILIGVSAVVLTVLILSNFVWSIDVNGNINVPTSQIMQVATENGLKEGALKQAIDYNEIEYQLKERFNKFAWISINENGTHISIEVSELIEKPDILDLSVPCDVVARYNGVIRLVEPYRGQAVVQQNQFVREGDILVSGTMEDTFQKTHYYHAMAKVIAQVDHSFSFYQPYDASLTIKTGETKQRHYLALFGLRIPLFIGGQPDGEWDMSTQDNWVHLFDKMLPIGIATKTYSFSQTEQLVLDETQAKRLLTEQAARNEEASLKDCKILNRSYRFEATETGVSMYTDYTVEQDIGEQKQIYFSALPEESEQAAE